MEKHFFAGNNTSKGFYSYFDSVFNPEKANRIYILKGGPGVGKSSFMKKIASRLREKNSIEYVHCSSDNESLDGIFIPELNIGFVDGTAPHTLDPTIPGAADEIINLGIFLDGGKLEAFKDQIVACNRKMSRIYKSAYRYLSCAGLVSDEINSIYDNCTDYKKFTILSEKIIYKLFGGRSSAEPLNPGGRKLFAEAYSADGYINYTDALCADKSVWGIKGNSINLSSALLERILAEAALRGCHTDCFYHPLHPEKLRHLLIADLDIMLVSTESQSLGNYDETIHLEQLTDFDMLKRYKAELENNGLLYDLLIDNALEKLSETKKEHAVLEAYYISSMDFNGVDACFETVCSKLAPTHSGPEFISVTGPQPKLSL